MVRVANCPKCNHEAVMFDLADNDDWARCPECRTYFQIKSVAAREIPPLVMSKDEALLAEEESAASVETVCSALETRWDDSRQTLSAVSSKTIAEVASAMANAQQNDDADDHRDDAQPTSDQPADSAPGKQEAAKHLTGTVADYSMLGTWNDLPHDEIEAEARAAEAGDAPIEIVDQFGDEPHLLDETAADANQLDQEFQFKETLSNFEPVEIDDAGELARADESVFDEADGILDEADDDSLTDESATDWNDPVEMVRLLTNRHDAADDVDVDDEPIDSGRFGDSKVAAASVTSPDIVPRRTQPQWAQSRRQRSAIRSIAMIAVAGLFGLTLGYYALFWIAGPNADFLGVAQYLPSGILPAEFRSVASPATRSESPVQQPSAPAEMQASHTEPVADEAALATVDDARETTIPVDNSAAVASDSAPNEVATTEPLELDPPAAAPLADESMPAETPNVIGAPSFTIEELTASLPVAREAQAGLIDGDLDGSVEEKRAKGKSYAILSDAAQKATFVVRQSPDAVAALDSEVQELFRTTLAKPETREEVARIVPMWLESANRKHGGIFFAGSVQSQTEKGNVVECEFDLGGQMLMVIVPTSRAESLPLAAEPVAIVGWLVDRPAESVSGYTGDAMQAVWAGHIIPLN